MTIAVITTFPEKNYKVYGERMIDSFVAHWPSNIILHVYYEGSCPPDKGDRVKYVDLHQASPDLVAFKQKHQIGNFCIGFVNNLDTTKTMTILLHSKMTVLLLVFDDFQQNQKHHRTKTQKCNFAIRF